MVELETRCSNTPTKEIRVNSASQSKSILHTSMESLERLQGLHADLVAFTEGRLANIDRLVQELQGTVSDFRKLLDKPMPSATDREKYNSGV